MIWKNKSKNLDEPDTQEEQGLNCLGIFDVYMSGEHKNKTINNLRN